MLETVVKKFPSQEFCLETLLKHFIDTGNAEPIKTKHYSFSSKVQDIMYEELDRIISIGVIGEAESP